MSHYISPRNKDAKKAFYPKAWAVPILIDSLRASWIGSVESTIICNENRFTLVSRYLVNHLGLILYEDKRVGADYGERLQVHHLPVQDHRVVADAVAKLREADLAHGVDRALWRLVDDHPYPFGDRVPEKPGYSIEDARRLDIKQTNRGPGGITLKQYALEWISKEWVTNSMWAKETRSTRLADFVDQLEKDGYVINAEIEGEAPGWATYRYYADPNDRAERAAAYERRKNDEARFKAQLKLEERQRKAQERATLKEAERKRRAEEKEKAAAEKRTLKLAAKQTERTRKAAETPASGKGSLSASSTRYGGWQTKSSVPLVAAQGSRPIFQGTEPPKPTRPAQATLQKLQELQPAASTKPDISAPDIPAAELNRLHPDVDTGFVAEIDGARYMRRWHKSGVKPDGRPLWAGSWSRVGAGSGHAPAR